VSKSDKHASSAPTSSSTVPLLSFADAGMFPTGQRAGSHPTMLAGAIKLSGGRNTKLEHRFRSLVKTHRQRRGKQTLELEMVLRRSVQTRR
jgi:hypothetical protein